MASIAIISFRRQAYDFEWLIGRNNLSLFVQPGKETALIVPQHIDVLTEQQFITGFVISAPENIEARNAIRQTWGKLIKPIFLMGLSDNETLNAVAVEAQIFDDIIVENFVDNYQNLTIKSAYAFKNFVKYFNFSDFFLKIDDDVFLGVENLHHMLKELPRDSLVGKKLRNVEPVRNECKKWFLPWFLYPKRYFPDYIYGFAYVIPG